MTKTQISGRVYQGALKLISYHRRFGEKVGFLTGLREFHTSGSRFTKPTDLAMAEASQGGLPITLNRSLFYSSKRGGFYPGQAVAFPNLNSRVVVVPILESSDWSGFWYFSESLKREEELIRVSNIILTQWRTISIGF